MGQYFKFVNEDKKEYVDPGQIGAGVKLWEIAANNGSNVLTLLLRRSEDESSAGIIGQIFENDRYAIIGRWAGDRVSLVGDYDTSNLYNVEDNKYRNITREVVKEWNKFMGNDKESSMKFICNDCSCSSCDCSCHV